MNIRMPSYNTHWLFVNNILTCDNWSDNFSYEWKIISEYGCSASQSTRFELVTAGTDRRPSPPSGCGRIWGSGWYWQNSPLVSHSFSYYPSPISEMPPSFNTNQLVESSIKISLAISSSLLLVGISSLFSLFVNTFSYYIGTPWGLMSFPSSDSSFPNFKLWEAYFPLSPSSPLFTLQSLQTCTPLINPPPLSTPASKPQVQHINSPLW